MIKSHYLQSAFKRCCLTLLFLSSLTSFNASSSDFTVDGLSYTMLSTYNLTCAVSGWEYSGDGNVVIPEMVTFRGRNISVIKINKTYWGPKLISLTMPSSVLEIAEGAFDSAEYLSEVNLSENLTTIPKDAFYCCLSLKKINIPSKVQFILENAFSNCRDLESVTGGESLVSIGQKAFWCCRSLQHIRFDGLRYIDQNAFSFCEALSNITIPSSVEVIDKYAFSYIDFKSFKIEDCEQPIKFYSDNCVASALNLYIGRDIIQLDSGNPIDRTRLEIKSGGTLELGKNVMNIDYGETRGWNEIGFLISHNLTPPWIPKMTNSNYLNLEVRVPAEALEAYKQAPVWKNFWNIKAIEDESGISDIECDDDDSFQVYDTAGILVDASCTSEKLQQLPHGIYIVVKQDKRMKLKI